MSDGSESFLQFSKSMTISCQLADTMAGDTHNGIKWEGHFRFLIGAMLEIIGGLLVFKLSKH